MNPEIEKMVKESLDLARENNAMLHKIRGVQKRQSIFQTLRFLLIIAITLGALYYIEPYITKVMNLYSSISGMENKFSPDSIKGLLGGFVK